VVVVVVVDEDDDDVRGAPMLFRAQNCIKT
jgi:hypothetical protein